MTAALIESPTEADLEAPTAEIATLADIDEEDEEDSEHFIGPGVRKPKNWFSGFCGAFGCNDGSQTLKSGERVFQCRGFGENGERAMRRYAFCACGCHDNADLSSEGAVQRSTFPEQEVRQSAVQKAAAQKAQKPRKR